MKAEESRQSAELNADHGDIDPRFGAGLGSLVIADQSPLAHQPAEGAFHHPAAWQDFEARGVIGAFDDRDRQLGPQPPDPAGECFAGVATIHPQAAQPGKPAQDPAQHLLRTIAFGGAGRGHSHAEHQPRGVHQQMALAAFDPFGGVIANGAFERPLPENMVDRLPSREIGGEITPRAATLDDLQDGIYDAPPVNGWASTFGKHRLKVSPLGIRETGLIHGVFHAPTEAALSGCLKYPNESMFMRVCGA
jgi:hypothetical protein